MLVKFRAGGEKRCTPKRQRRDNASATISVTGTSAVVGCRFSMMIFMEDAFAVSVMGMIVMSAIIV